MIIHPRSPSEAVVGMLEEEEQEQAHSSITSTAKQTVRTTNTQPSLTIEEDSTEGSFDGDYLYDDDSTNASSVVTAACELPHASPAQEETELSPLRFQKSSVKELEEASNDDGSVLKDLEDLDKKPNSSTTRIQPITEEASTSTIIGTTTTTLPRRPLKSSLRSSSTTKTNIRLSVTRKPRVHGLWNEDKCVNPFAMLHDPLLLQIFTSFLDLQDLCRCQGVSQRFASLAHHEEVWRHIDATSFMEASYQRFQRQQHRNPAQATTELLVQTWQSKAPVSIRIDKIGNRLEANSFCLPNNTKRLQTLTLSQFDDLTDTHVHVLLLSSKTAPGAARPTPATKNNISITPTTTTTAQSRSRINRRRSSMTHPWALQQITLTDCPRLTNASLRSVANMCHQLRELNVTGCRLMDDLAALQPLWKLRPRARDDDDANVSSASAMMTDVLTMSERSTNSFCYGGSSTMSSHASPAPNVKKTANLETIFLPPSPAPQKSAASLGSLFAPPPTASATATKPAAAASLPPNAKKNDILESLFAPPQPPPPQKSATGGGLMSLFAPPSAAVTPKKPTATPPSLGGLFEAPQTTPKKPSFSSSTNGLAGLFAPPASPFSKGTPPLKPATKPALTATGLGSLFLPPVNATSKSPPANATKKEPPPTSNGSLGSLFASPGTTDAAKSNAEIFSSRTTSNNRMGMFSNSSSSLASLDQAPKVKVGKELCRLDVSHTGVTPDMLIRCLTEATAQVVEAGFVVALESLTAANRGDNTDLLWNDSHLRALARVIDASALKQLDISCYREIDSNEGAEGRVTDAGLLSLFFGITEDKASTKNYGRFSAAANAPMLQLEEMSLEGHPLVTEDVLDHIRDASIATNMLVRM